MEELKFKISELEQMIWVYENQAMKALDFGNPPKENYEKALEALTKRQSLVHALDNLMELEHLINKNNSTLNF